jgi:transaldolase
MQFFIDTASLDAIRHWQTLGLVDGATTNPALLAKEGGDPLEQLRQVCELVGGPVSAQVTHTASAGMIAQGRALSQVAPNVVVKLPATEDGLLAARELTGEGIDCNITLTFQPAQAIPFLRIPVAYVSLIVGRVEDFGLTSLEAIHQTRAMFDEIGSPTKLLVASFRNPTQVAEAVMGSADVLTVPPSTWELIFQNPLTSQGAADFASAWSALPPEARASYEELGRSDA